MKFLEKRMTTCAIMIDGALHNVQFDETAFMLTSYTMSTSK